MHIGDPKVGLDTAAQGSGADLPSFWYALEGQRGGNLQQRRGKYWSTLIPNGEGAYSPCGSPKAR